MVSSLPLNPISEAIVPTPTLYPERPTLLIVDDEEGPRQSLRVVFKDHYNLLLASDGPAALELARTHDSGVRGHHDNQNNYDHV